jgi:hypothetical protein
MGDEWIRIDLREPATIRLVQLMLADRSLGDYPRGLVVESIGPDHIVRTVFEGSVLPHLGAGIVRDGRYPTLAVVLDDNRSTAIRLRQTGTTRTFYWSIHEIALWEQKTPGRTAAAD